MSEPCRLAAWRRNPLYPSDMHSAVLVLEFLRTGEQELAGFDEVSDDDEY